MSKWDKLRERLEVELRNSCNYSYNDALDSVLDAMDELEHTDADTFGDTVVSITLHTDFGDTSPIHRAHVEEVIQGIVDDLLSAYGYSVVGTEFEGKIEEV
jgi:hypothetical protein